jgi:hypothetical protein
MEIGSLSPYFSDTWARPDAVYAAVVLIAFSPYAIIKLA